VGTAAQRAGDAVGEQDLGAVGHETGDKAQLQRRARIGRQPGGGDPTGSVPTVRE
jgi:hypothetical protein